MPTPTLRNLGANQTCVSLKGVNMYFSYDACIAFDGLGLAYFNPKYRKYSVTTSKHATQMGVKGYVDAASAEAFEAALSAALAD